MFMNKITAEEANILFLSRIIVEDASSVYYALLNSKKENGVDKRVHDFCTMCETNEGLGWMEVEHFCDVYFAGF